MTFSSNLTTTEKPIFSVAAFYVTFTELSRISITVGIRFSRQTITLTCTTGSTFTVTRTRYVCQRAKNPTAYSDTCSTLDKARGVVFSFFLLFPFQEKKGGKTRRRDHMLGLVQPTVSGFERSSGKWHEAKNVSFV